MIIALCTLFKNVLQMEREQEKYERFLTCKSEYSVGWLHYVHLLTMFKGMLNEK